MPNWRFHIGVADMITKEYDIKNVAEFRLGNVWPDAPWLSTQDSVMLGFRETLHVAKKRNGSFIGISDWESWLHDNDWEVAHSDFYKGYLAHLILDFNVNLFWSLRTEREAIDRVIIHTKSGLVPYTVSKAAHTKWDDTAKYAAERFSYLDGASEVIIWSAIGEYVQHELESTFCCSDNDIHDARVSVIEDVTKKRTFESEYLFKEQYDIIVEHTVKQCAYLFKIVDSIY